MRGSRTDHVDIISDGSADSGSDENSESSSDGCGDSFFDEGLRMSSDEGAYISSDEGRYMGSDEGEDSSLDEGVYSSSDEDVHNSSDEDMYNSSDEGADTTVAKGVHRRMKEKMPRMLCTAVCNCPEDYTVVHGVKIKLSSGRWASCVRLINGVDNRATITRNWSDFAKKAKLTKEEICVFSLRARNGKPEFTVHKI